MGLILGFIFCSIDLYISFFLPISCCFDHCSFVVLSKVWEGYASCKNKFSFSIIIPYLLTASCIRNDNENEEFIAQNMAILDPEN